MARRYRTIFPSIVSGIFAFTGCSEQGASLSLDGSEVVDGEGDSANYSRQNAQGDRDQGNDNEEGRDDLKNRDGRDLDGDRDDSDCDEEHEQDDRCRGDRDDREDCNDDNGNINDDDVDDNNDVDDDNDDEDCEGDESGGLNGEGAVEVVGEGEGEDCAGDTPGTGTPGTGTPRTGTPTPEPPAPPTITGACGSAAHNYSADVFQYPATESLCAAGEPASSPGFPAPGGSASWFCLGSNGGADAVCAATRFVCDPGTAAACGIANGSGVQQCDASGSGYGQCTLASCDAGFASINGACVGGFTPVMRGFHEAAQTHMWTPDVNTYSIWGIWGWGPPAPAWYASYADFGAGTVPMHLCRSVSDTNDFVVTGSADCEGQPGYSDAGYIGNGASFDPGPGWAPLYRYTRSVNVGGSIYGRHLTTAFPDSEILGGWSFEGAHNIWVRVTAP